MTASIFVIPFSSHGFGFAAYPSISGTRTTKDVLFGFNDTLAFLPAPSLVPQLLSSQ